MEAFGGHFEFFPDSARKCLTQKRWVIEQNGARFRTRDNNVSVMYDFTRKCTMAAFGGHFQFFPILARKCTTRKRCVVEWNEARFRTRDTNITGMYDFSSYFTMATFGGHFEFFPISARKCSTRKRCVVERNRARFWSHRAKRSMISDSER